MSALGLLGIGTAVSGLFSGLSNAYSANQSYKAQLAANEGNMELAKYSYSKDLEQWNRQNEYNSPSAQMQRYADAGLNPNLIYGSGTASAGNASSSPSFNAPTLQPATKRAPDYGAILGDSLAMFNNLRSVQKDLQIRDADIAIKSKTLDKLDAEINNINSQANYNRVRSIVGDWDSKLKEQSYGFNSHYNPISLAYLSSKARNEALNSSVISENIQNLQQQRQLLGASYEQIKAQTENTIAHTAYTRNQNRFLLASFQKQLSVLDNNIKLGLAQLEGLKHAGAIADMEKDMTEYKHDTMFKDWEYYRRHDKKYDAHPSFDSYMLSTYDAMWEKFGRFLHNIF
jgi:hypothetical protein